MLACRFFRFIAQTCITEITDLYPKLLILSLVITDFLFWRLAALIMDSEYNLVCNVLISAKICILNTQMMVYDINKFGVCTV